ncbi:hypothetical protein ACP70R_001722 [Stipagrostis hirtigluma subsp. patula]
MKAGEGDQLVGGAHCPSLFPLLVFLLHLCLAGARGVAAADGATTAAGGQRDVGVILDLGTWVGNISWACMELALEDFYSSARHSNYNTRVRLHLRDTSPGAFDAVSAEEVQTYKDLASGRLVKIPLKRERETKPGETSNTITKINKNARTKNQSSRSTAMVQNKKSAKSHEQHIAQDLHFQHQPQQPDDSIPEWHSKEVEQINELQNKDQENEEYHLPKHGNNCHNSSDKVMVEWNRSKVVQETNTTEVLPEPHVQVNQTTEENSNEAQVCQVSELSNIIRNKTTELRIQSELNDMEFFPDSQPLLLNNEFSGYFNSVGELFEEWNNSQVSKILHNDQNNNITPTQQASEKCDNTHGELLNENQQNNNITTDNNQVSMTSFTELLQGPFSDAIFEYVPYYKQN